jgi:hypothetical protein
MSTQKVDEAFRSLVGQFGADVDVMQDVYMTREQRAAYDRILSAARRFNTATPDPSQPTAGGEAVAAFKVAAEIYDDVREGRTQPYERFYTAPVVAGEAVRLRRMLAFAYSGANLYTDDGELQDNARQPYIDFLRDSPEQIKAKMRDRALAALDTEKKTP